MLSKMLLLGVLLGVSLGAFVSWWFNKSLAHHKGTKSPRKTPRSIPQIIQSGSLSLWFSLVSLCLGGSIKALLTTKAPSHQEMHQGQFLKSFRAVLYLCGFPWCLCVLVVQ
jgi:hypothetical protein